MPTARKIIGVERAESLRIMDEKHNSYTGQNFFDERAIDIFYLMYYNLVKRRPNIGSMFDSVGKEMSGMEQKRMKILITILAVLLFISLAALAGVWIRKGLQSSAHTTVTVPDNIVTPESENPTASTVPSDTHTGTDHTSAGEKQEAKALWLHTRHPGDNTPFTATNMFPGDRETRYYCVRVSHKANVLLRFRAEIRPGYEGLADVLQCRIVLPATGEVLYEGLMRDMPVSLNHPLHTQKNTISEVYYAVTAYLDTGVGNEYMDTGLIADFRWWVEETDSLTSPQTGDSIVMYGWLSVAVVSLLLLLILRSRRKKEAQTDER